MSAAGPPQGRNKRPSTVASSERDFRPTPPDALRRRYRGCLLGGAVGDALGAPVEFMSLVEIRERFGPAGVTDLTTAHRRPGEITDDTQLALFTAEGLLRAHVKEALEGSANVAALVAHAYLRWLATQEAALPDLLERGGDQGWLMGLPELKAQRVPAQVLLDTLSAMTVLGSRARNDHKGSAAASRMAPVGLYCARLPGATDQRAARRAFDLGCELAGLTHGHPLACNAGGAFAAIVALLVRDWEVDEAVEEAMGLLERRALGMELRGTLTETLRLAGNRLPPEQALKRLGEGWNADEALAIALYATMRAEDFTGGVLVAVNHDGDSDSTGAMAGSLLGALHGVENVPRKWLSPVEAGAAIAAMADDLATWPEWPIGEYVEESEASHYWRSRYPPL